jgi:hypothetical protein
MKFTRRQAATLLATPAVFYAAGSLTPTEISAASETNPEFREAVQAAMLEYIDSTAINGKHLIFDPIVGDYVQATFKKLHSNLSKVEDTFFVSCADFEDANGNLLDVDYMVAESYGYWSVFQAVIHARDGEVRATHMETAEVIVPKEGCCAGKCCSAKCCSAKCCSAKCCSAKCCSAKCCSAKCCSAKCCSAKCCSAKCCSAKDE